MQYARLGIIQYHSYPEAVIVLGSIKDPKILNATIGKIFYKDGGRRTDLALMKAKEVFTSPNVAYRQASKVLLLVMGGPDRELFVGQNASISAADLLKSPTDDLHKSEVSVIAVGVQLGLGDPDKASLTEQLKLIASEPLADHVVEVPDFDQLLSKVDILANKSCAGAFYNKYIASYP